MQKLFEVYDNRFLALINPDSRLEQLCSGARWAEGPIYFAEGDYLIWSDIKNNRMLRWSDKDGMSIYRAPANYTNGNYRDLQGRMVTCSHGARAVQRTRNRWHSRDAGGPLPGRAAEFPQRSGGQV